MLMDAYDDESPGIRIVYRTHGQLPHQLLMQSQSCASRTTVHKILLASNRALNTTSEGDMQRSMNLFAVVCDNFGLVINTEKATVMHQTPPKVAYSASQINMNDVQVQAVSNFTYLRSTLSRSTKVDNEMAHGVSKTIGDFGRLQNTVCKAHSLHLGTELKMHKVVILPTQLHEAETWTM
nr:unnamed protein product [Spirometra erinaceieuropaei]